MPGDPLDLILTLLVVAFAIGGYRQGFIVGALGCIGFLAGAAVGAVCSGAVARYLAPDRPAPQALVAIIVVFLAAVAGQVLASMGGMAIRSRVTWPQATLIDGFGGAGISALSVLLIAGFIGSAVASVPFSEVSMQVRSSVLLRGVDRLIPPLAGLQRFLDSGPYVQVFGALAVDRELAAPPSQRVLDSPGLARDRQSVVKIAGAACGHSLTGSGFVFAPHHVLTNAHVVAGVTTGLSVSNGGRNPMPAQVVLFDPRRDIAVLYVPQLNAVPLILVSQAPAGSGAIVAGYPGTLPFTAVPARVSQQMAVSVPDIYLNATVTRELYALRATVRPGNSGSPLLAPGGSVYGMVFATSAQQPGYGAALTSGEVTPDATLAATATTPVSTQRCTP